MPIRLLLWTCVPLSVFASWFSWQLYWQAEPISLARETTLITGPLADDGLPSYSMFLVQRMKADVTADNNGAPAFVRAMWPAELHGNDKQLVCTELGMTMPTEEGLSIPYADKALMAALAKWCDPAEKSEFLVPEEDLLEAIEAAPWTAADAPPLAQWIEQHAEQFELLHEAARQEEFYFPSPTLLADPKASLHSMRTPATQTLRTAAKCLALRANLRVGSGDLRGAWDDCRAIYHLADVQTHSTVLCELLAYKREEIANRTLWHIVQSPQLTSELAEEMATCLGSRQPQHSLRDTLRSGARIDFVTELLEISGYRRTSAASAHGGVAYGQDDIDHKPAIDWCTVLRIANEEYDLYLAAADQPTYTEQQAALNAWTDRVSDLAKEPEWTNMLLDYEVRTNHMAYELAKMIPSRLAAAIENGRRITANRQLHLTAVALARYRLSTGEYPQSLDGLLPEYLAEMPMDPFDRALAYTRTPDGYLLYSLGRDGQDSGGSNNMLNLYQGYPIPESPAKIQQLRQQLGALPRSAENTSQPAVMDKWGPRIEDDDIALRMPHIQYPLPQFEWQE
ncbi:type II secretion system protein GspG [Aeoliella sp. ICT_H6.2]|uniref:Type II secretion system protein GspG n=1 Tax=Aeoliella straminimaris TaxID=2954799 RepID=A0A9X2F9P9_9BACT|nr:type II secretion system protein GspG [Aeoliella straminimaris]MCO6044987.1 type II secretion system protein GspG [Aeoliella straminimaris]